MEQADSQKIFVYLCLNCKTKRELRLKDAVRCTDCGNRILRKIRSDGYIQLEAR